MSAHAFAHDTRNSVVERGQDETDSDTDGVTPLAIALATALALVGGTAFSAVRRLVRREEAPGY